MAEFKFAPVSVFSRVEVYTCWKPVVLEKQFFLFHALDLNRIFANEDPLPPPPPNFKTKKFLPLREPQTA